MCADKSAADGHGRGQLFPANDIDKGGNSVSFPAAGSGRGKAQLQCKLCTSYVQVMYILYAFPLAFCSIVWPNSGIRAMRRKFVPLRCARESAGT